LLYSSCCASWRSLTAAANSACTHRAGTGVVVQGSGGRPGFEHESKSRIFSRSCSRGVGQERSGPPPAQLPCTGWPPLPAKGGGQNQATLNSARLLATTNEFT
jgi:hypothetical protein